MKKQIKKILTIIILLALGIQLNVKAANVSGDLRSSEIKSGTFDVIVSATCDEGFNAISGKIIYDEEKLELVSSSVTTNKYANLGEGLTLEIIVNSTDKITSDDIFKLTFKVKDGIQEETTAKIAITEMKIYSDTGAEYSIDDKEISIPIVAENGSPVDPTDPTDPTDPVDPVDPSNPNDNNKEDENNGTNDNKQSDTSKNDDKDSTVKKETTGEDLTAKDKMPYTGRTTIIASIAILGIISGALYIAYRKYKNI